MAQARHYFWALSLSLSFYFIVSQSSSHVYIVYLGHNQNKHPLLTSNHHLQLLSNVFERKEDAKQAMLYSYKHGFSGFSATMNSVQAKSLANTEGVVSVFKSETLDLHTTRSWDFLGLSMDHSEGIPWQEAYGGDIIVGIIDTGIWPESYSFREEPGMGPVPKSWKGTCVGGEKFDPARACNRKLIGAKYYIKGFERRYGSLNETGYPDYRSPYDALGHGTHTASTAVGSVVRDANFLGFGRGTARGGAPRARLAVYKSCWNLRYDGKCTEADILAAFDDALCDGVNVISGSFGLKPPLKLYFRSASDIGSFHAMQKGVSVVFSAGNNGPDPSLVENVSPWSISVAASTIDRTFPTEITLDCGALSLLGEGFVVDKIKASLVNASSFFSGGICLEQYNKSITAEGKVVLCFSSLGPVTRNDAEFAARAIKAAGLIFVEPLSRLSPDLTILPVVQIDIIQGNKLSNYMDLAQPSNPPAVEIFPSKTVLRRSPAPIVADFSSRGPSSMSPDFLKPDITAPGVNILAAWPPTSPPTLYPEDKRRVTWNFLTGTSMSCPHVAGVIALLKSAHPDWSPAVVRSALMTTAYTTDTTGDQILAAGTIKSSDPFDIGAGHINPLGAMDPGLVYDMKTTDYIIFLCNIGYSRDQIRILVSPDFTTDYVNTICPTKTNPGGGISSTPLMSTANLNYPSITVLNLQRTTTIKRTVRNVGWGLNMISVYFVRVVNPNGVDVVVWPRLLIFSPFKQERTYYVTLNPNKISQGRYDFGEIVWSDGSHHVRSPLVVFVNTTTATQATAANTS